MSTASESPQFAIDSVTVKPRRPSIIHSTTSAPLTPKILEKKKPRSSRQRDDDDAIFQMDDMDQSLRTETHSDTELVMESHEKDDEEEEGGPPSPEAQPIAASNGWEKRETPTNPWSLQVYNRDMQKMRHHLNEPQVQQYILIEDLTDGVRYPCVLDLKMGTRQYGVYATPEKMKSQTLKCARSTSQALGVRVCGMQAGIRLSCFTGRV